MSLQSIVCVIITPIEVVIIIPFLKELTTRSHIEKICEIIMVQNMKHPVSTLDRPLCVRFWGFFFGFLTESTFFSTAMCAGNLKMSHFFQHLFSPPRDRWPEIPNLTTGRAVAKHKLRNENVHTQEQKSMPHVRKQLEARHLYFIVFLFSSSNKTIPC